MSLGWGLPGDKPVAADFDGDGLADVAVFRPGAGTATWFIRNSSGIPFTTFDWGLGSDTPLAADFDGDGKADPTAYRPANGEWWVRGVGVAQWGLPGDLPLVGRH